MKIITFDGYWTIDIVRTMPKYLFVFGDNDVKKGTGGQAIIRHEENAIGIPTKKLPNNVKTSFYTDDEYESNISKIDIAIEDIFIKVKEENYEGIVLPIDGFGTGLAKLKDYAPRTLIYLEKKIEEIKNTHSDHETIKPT